MRKLTNQQEKFAELVANGGSYSDAHREAYPKSRDWKDKTVNENASRLYSKVYARVEEIKAALAKKNLWTREKSVEALKEVIQNPEKNTDIVAAVKELNSMHGYHEPEKHDHTSSDGSMSPAKQQLSREEIEAEIKKAGFDPKKVSLDE